MPNKILPLLTDVVFAAWFVLVAVSFFGPYLGLVVPAELTARGYAVLLVIALVTLALRLVRRAGKAPTASVIAGKGGAP
jgi:hypothetical protein